MFKLLYKQNHKEAKRACPLSELLPSLVTVICFAFLDSAHMKGKIKLFASKISVIMITMVKLA